MLPTLDIANNKMKILEFCSGKEDYQISEASIFWKHFELTDDEGVYFSNFMHNGTFTLFNLIQPEYRNRIITKMVKEIKKFVDIIAKK